MENQKDKKKKKVLMPFGLRNKLMAAISMLLVSSIMLVSSTYAWFTLSTAPEVKGISTSVGANGNLEMALLTSGDADLNNGANTFENLDKITSAVGDSSAATNNLGKSNLTWGNLVDLSYQNATTNKNYYGLDQIKLMPARLNNEKKADGVAADPTKLVLTSPLLTPKYGDDGRVTEVNGATLFSADFDKVSNQGFKAGNVDTYGVRAVGESGDMSPQAKGLMASQAAYTSNLNAAKNLVQASLETNMQDLFNAVLGLATTDGYKLKEVEKTAITNLLDGIGAGLDKIDLAYGDVLRAYAANQLNAADYEAAMKVAAVEANVEDGTPAVTVANGTYTQIVSKLNNVTVPTEDNAFTSAVRDLTTMKSAVTTARDHVTKQEYAEAVKCLVDTTKVELNGLSLNKPNPADATGNYDGTVWKWDTKKNEVDVDAAKLLKAGVGSNAIIDMQSGSGLFVGIADVTGNYSAIRNDMTISVPSADFDLTDATVTMKTSSTVATPNDVTKLIKGITANGDTDGVVKYITDAYGYIIDLAVRTNATNSNLLLASDGVQRVYTDASNTQTMGAGSTMTFESVKEGENAVLKDEQVAKLMTAIRVVFFDPDNGSIYGIAQLTGISSADGKTTGKLALMNASVDDNGVMKLTAKEDGTDVEKATLMALQQNTATKISVLVYLDGDMVDNGMVANAEQSVTGSLNLQFKSSAELKPMENSALKNGTTN